MGLQNAVTSFLDTIQVNLQVQNVLYEICQAVDEHANLKALAEIGSQRAQVDAKLQRWQVEKQMLLDKVNKVSYKFVLGYSSNSRALGIHWY